MNTAPLNLERFRLTAETPEEESEVLAIFFDLAGKSVGDMERAGNAGEQEKWRAAAHYLKGSAANLGMMQLAEACKQAELCTALDGTKTDQFLSAIRNELTSIWDYFSSLGRF